MSAPLRRRAKGISQKNIHKIVRTFVSALESSKKQTRTNRSKDTSSERSCGSKSSSAISSDEDELTTTPSPPNFPVEACDGPNIIFGYTQSVLNMKHVEGWLMQAEREEAYSDKIMVQPPVKPRGGEILLYKCKGASDLDHHRDQYTGFNMTGSNKGKGQSVLKKYFKMYDEDGNQLSFQKATYERTSSSEKDNKVVLIHYIGDHTVYKDRPHGNSKSGRNYTATTKKAMKKAEKVVQETGKGSQAIYEKLIKEAGQRSDFSEREPVVAPRDRKQIENLKHRVEIKSRLLRCDIFSAIEMGRNNTLGKFILRHVVNPFDMIIMAEPAALRLASNLLMEAGRDPELPQYLCYDTTFNLADAFVSAVVIRNTYIVGNPLLPVIFLIHERKLEAVHAEFFRELADVVHLDQLSLSVPIVFDRERAISNAVRRVIPDVKVVYCTNHIVRDVKYWVKNSGGKQDDIKVLKGHVRRMLDCETEQEFDGYFESVSEMWSQEFKDYFQRQLYSDIKNCAARLYTDQFSAFKGKTVTNNASESLNFMIKNQNDWKELRVDSLIMSLFNLQLSLLQEFDRAFKPAGLGGYVLKPEYKSYGNPVIVPMYMTWTEAQFLETFREGVYMPLSNIEKPANYMQARSSLAKLTCQQNLVSLDSRAGVFVVTGLYNGRRVIVKRTDSGTLECTCNSTGYCYHKLAVLYSLNVDISEDKETYSLSILRRKGRGKRTGRKGPNVDDLITNVEPAPDSDLAAKVTRSELVEGCRENQDNEDDNLENVEAAALTQSDSEDEEVIVTSEGARSEDDDSFQAIHHYSKEQFIDPIDNNEIPRSSVTGSRSLSDDIDVPEFLLLSNVPDSIPKKWTSNSTYECLKPRRWIAEDILNDMTRLLIQSLKLEESVALVNTHEFNVIRKAGLSQYATEALRCQGVNSDILLVNICMNNHFLFAVVMYRPKVIVVVDSLPGVVSVETVYRPLFLLVAATYYVGFVDFQPSEWKFIIEEDIASQPNGYDCGVFAILNQYQMFIHQPFSKTYPPSETLRRWILYCLHTTEFKGSLLIPRCKKIKRLVPRDKTKVEHLLSTLDIPELEPICESGSCFQQIVQELKVCRRAWAPCAVDDCKATVDDNDYVMCCYCRSWFHLGPCIPETDANKDYFLCCSCINYRITG